VIGIQYAGGLGNQMFQHAFARLLEQTHGVPLGRWRGVSPALRPFPATAEGVRDEEVRQPLTVLPPANSMARIDSQTESDLNLGGLRTALQGGDVLLHGYFQKFHYYAGRGPFLRSLFRMEPVEIKEKPETDDLVIYLQSYFNVRPDFFLREIPKLRFRNLWIMVNDLERGWDMVGQIRKAFGGRIVHLFFHLKDFTFLRLAVRILAAPSTFAWWAAYLSEAVEIVFARPSLGYGSRTHGVASLEVSDESRYRYVDYRV